MLTTRPKVNKPREENHTQVAPLESEFQPDFIDQLIAWGDANGVSFADPNDVPMD